MSYPTYNSVSWCSLRWAAIAVTVAALFAAWPVKAQSGRNATDIITAEYTSALTNLHALRKRDGQIADDRLREAEEKLSAQRAHVRTLSQDLQRAKQAASSTKIALAEKETALNEARADLAGASRAFTAMVAQKDENFRIALAAYQAQMTKLADEATPEEREALQRFADGDDAAYAAMEKIVAAENAATDAVAARAKSARLGQLALLQQVRAMRGQGSRTEVIAAWSVAIAADPTNGSTRVSLCSFVVLDVGLIGEWGPESAGLTANPADVEQASAICRSLVNEATSLEDRLSILAVLAEVSHLKRLRPQTLEATADAKLMLDRAEADGVGTIGMLRPIVQIAAIQGRVDEAVFLEARSAARDLLPSDKRWEQRKDDKRAATGERLHAYREASRRADRILSAQHAFRHDQRVLDALLMLARGAKEVDRPWSRVLLMRLRQLAEEALALDPGRTASRVVLAETLIILASVMQDEEAAPIYALGVAEWRIVSTSNAELIYVEKLADALKNAADDLASDTMGARKLEYRREIVALRQRLAENAPPQAKREVAWSVALAESSLAEICREMDDLGCAIEHSIAAIEIMEAGFRDDPREPRHWWRPSWLDFSNYDGELETLAEYFSDAGDRANTIIVMEARLKMLRRVSTDDDFLIDHDVAEIERELAILKAASDTQ